MLITANKYRYPASFFFFFTHTYNLDGDQKQIDKNRQKSTKNRQTSRQLNRQMHVCMSMPARQASQRQSDDVWARNACPHALPNRKRQTTHIRRPQRPHKITIQKNSIIKRL